MTANHWTRQVLLLGAWLAGALIWTIRHDGASCDQCVMFSRGRQIYLGRLSAGSTKLEFAVSNCGRSPFHVARVSGSCGCAHIDMESGAVLPADARKCTVNLDVTAGDRKSVVLTFELESDGEQPRVWREAVLVQFEGYRSRSIRLESESSSVIAARPSRDGEFIIAAVVASDVGDAPVEWTVGGDAGLAIQPVRADGHGGGRSEARLCWKAMNIGETRVGTVEARCGAASASSTYVVQVPETVRATPKAILATEAHAIWKDGAPISIRAERGWRVVRIRTDDWLTADPLETRDPGMLSILTVRANRSKCSVRSVGHVFIEAEGPGGEIGDVRLDVAADLPGRK